MSKYDLRLSTGMSTVVESNHGLEGLLRRLNSVQGEWLTDEYGWRINPMHIVLVRRVDDEDDDVLEP